MDDSEGRNKSDIETVAAEIEARIAGLERWRDTYFLHHPNAPQEEFAREMRERANSLIQEIPVRVARNSPHYLYLEGRIRNTLCVEHDAKAEELLERCTRADSQRIDAWLELGNCAWRRADLAKALTSFRQAEVLLKRRGKEGSESPEGRKLKAKVLCLLSAAYRSQLASIGGMNEKLKRLYEALQLCEEAISACPDYAFGHYSLANTLLAKFFLIGQRGLQENDLHAALSAYERALANKPNKKEPSRSAKSTPDNSHPSNDKNKIHSLSTTSSSPSELPPLTSCKFACAGENDNDADGDDSSFISADLYINYGVALRYAQRYPAALTHFHRATRIEPHFHTASEHLQSLSAYLAGVDDALAKPKIPQRRWRELRNALVAERTQKWARQHDPLLKVVGVRELVEASEMMLEEESGLGESGSRPTDGLALLVAVLGRVPNESDEAVPRTLITTDSEGRCIALAVYNFSTSKFSTLIGDQLLVPKPQFIRVKLNLGAEAIDGEEQFPRDSKHSEEGYPSPLCPKGSEEETSQTKLEQPAVGKKAHGEEKNNEKDIKTKKGREVEFAMVRVRDPCALVKNGKPVETACRAFTQMSINVSNNDKDDAKKQ